MFSLVEGVLMSLVTFIDFFFKSVNCAESGAARNITMNTYTLLLMPKETHFG